MAPRERQKLQPKSNTPARDYEWEPSTYNQLSNRMEENVRFTGDKEDSWKRDFWTARNPQTGQKITESTIDRGTDTISNRFVYPSGQWDDSITGESGQLKGPQTWDYDPASWTGDNSGILTYGRDYLFNGGGSVRSRTNRPNMRDVAGPTQIERILQDNTSRPSTGGMDLDMLRNLQQAPGVIDRMIREETPPGGGVIKPQNPTLPPWQRYNDIGEGSFWNVQAPQQTEDNLGIMAALNQQGNSKKWYEDNNLSFGISLDPRPNVSTEPEYNSGISGVDYTPVDYTPVDYSPDGEGRWLTESPTGNKFLSYMVNQAEKAGFASQESVDYMQNAIEGGGIPLWGGYARPTWEDDNYGFMWKKGG